MYRFLVFANLALTVHTASAIPRYSARYGQTCDLCHHNPTGGGQRSLYASQYLVPTEMSMREYGMDELAGFDPQLSDNVTLGADLRTVYSYLMDGQPELENFFQMQTDLELSIQFDESYSAYVDRGMSGTYEAFGLGYIFPTTAGSRSGASLPPSDGDLPTTTAPCADTPASSPRQPATWESSWA